MTKYPDKRKNSLLMKKNKAIRTNKKNDNMLKNPRNADEKKATRMEATK